MHLLRSLVKMLYVCLNILDMLCMLRNNYIFVANPYMYNYGPVNMLTIGPFGSIGEIDNMQLGFNNEVPLRISDSLFLVLDVREVQAASRRVPLVEVEVVLFPCSFALSLIKGE